MAYVSQSRSAQTLSIESMLLDGVMSLSEIARIHQVTRGRVQFIKRRMIPPATPVAGPGSTLDTPLQSSGMKTLNLHLTPAIYAALIEACAASNIGTDDEPNTIEDYAGEVLMTHLQGLGLIRRKRK